MLRRCFALAIVGAGVTVLASSTASAVPKPPEPTSLVKKPGAHGPTPILVPKKAATVHGHGAGAKAEPPATTAPTAPTAPSIAKTKDLKVDAKAPGKVVAAPPPVAAIVPRPAPVLVPPAAPTPPAPPAPVLIALPPAPPLPWPVAPKVGLTVERFQLANGLRVLLVPDASVPTIAVAVTYDVGSRDESVGRTGFAHLFEHMMFQGSANVPRGAFDRYLSARGGSNNGTTNEDRTEYYEQLPSHELPLALWLEADRMAALQVTPENFENQRAVVKEEYRMSVANRPYALSGIALQEKVYANYPAYAHDAIGSMEDLDAAAFPWVEEFHRKHYGPNRAILAIAGALDVAEARSLVEKYFAPIAASAEAAPCARTLSQSSRASTTAGSCPRATTTIASLLRWLRRCSETASPHASNAFSCANAGWQSRSKRALTTGAARACSASAP